MIQLLLKFWKFR